MTFVSEGFMPLNRQLFRRSIAEALAELLSQKYASAKSMARALGIDPSTAENLRKGHLSVPTLEKALVAEGRDLWRRLGEEIFGESELEYEERVLSARIMEAERARENIRRLGARREALAQAGLGGSNLGLGLASQPAGREGSVRGNLADGAGEQNGSTLAEPIREGRSFDRP
jgi:transcriptional regulator with XRE-family HTH domain